MTLFPFSSDNLSTVSEALEVAEDKTGDYFKFSFGQWKRHHYDVKTMSALKENEIAPHAFALLNKASRVIADYKPRTENRDFYFICLQDKQIMTALKRDEDLGLFPLLVYIFTHELVHIVRFCNFFQRFEISGEGREKEEKVVHQTTYEILKDLSMSQVDYVLQCYRDHRICEFAIS